MIAPESMEGIVMANTAPPSLLTRLRKLFVGTSGDQRIWVLTSAIALLAALGAYGVRSLEVLDPTRTIPPWVLAGLFYAGEITVVHVKFKRNTQSFSMSEIPLVLGLFFVSPWALLGAQLVGNAAALTLNRRQPPIKLAFNMVQFTLVTVVSISMFRLLISGADPFGPYGWLAAIATVATANVVANALVHVAIRATGGRLTKDQLSEVLLLSTMGAAVNASLALLSVTLFEMRPSSVWLAVIPIVVLYGAYRAYIGQKQERYRLESLYEVVRVLHASPQIDVAIDVAAAQTIKMFEADRVDFVLIDQQGRGRVLQTTVDSEGPVRSMARVGLLPEHDLFGWLDALQQPSVLTEMPPIPNASLLSDEIMAAPLTTETGTIGAVVVTEPLSDVGGFGVSDVKLLGALAAEISVSLQNGRLEDSLQELTRVKEQLEDQVRSKDQFIATVSHELRTPLTTVLGLSHELGERRPSFSEAELDEIVSLIASESTELANLIEDLLVGARADVSTLSLHPQFVRISDELSSVIDGHTHQTAGEPVGVRWKTRRDKLWADPLRLRQIVRNLLTNATRYGGSEIWIEVSDNEDTVVVSVLDNGLGVPTSLEARIFEAYERGHEAEDTRPGSVGLGLAVSRRLADLMGGTLEYRRVDDNTCFDLVLPAFP
ncbi:MAG: GAF domain-containing sensor histidine kinase [bacterium]|nr:GAF domain-containing sensor histidine kinase [bacterium]MCP4964131.1 GAF domain-containing sensor histidine kinase [bacterium]